MSASSCPVPDRLSAAWARLLISSAIIGHRDDAEGMEHGHQVQADQRRRPAITQRADECEGGIPQEPYRLDEGFHGRFLDTDMLAQVANLDPPFLDESPDETRADVKPCGHLIDGQQAINGRYGELRWGSVKMGGPGGGCGITLRSWALRETEMDRVGLGEIEREIDAEARERFPGGAVRQVVLLQYGEDPEIEPGDLWVRVVLDADGPDDYERSVQAFQHDHEAAMEEFAGHLARTLREIRLVEFTPEKTVDREGHGPRCHLGVSERLADARAWELGEFTGWTCTPRWAAPAWRPSTH